MRLASENRRQMKSEAYRQSVGIHARVVSTRPPTKHAARLTYYRRTCQWKKHNGLSTSLMEHSTSSVFRSHLDRLG